MVCHDYDNVYKLIESRKSVTGIVNLRHDSLVQSLNSAIASFILGLVACAGCWPWLPSSSGGGMGAMGPGPGMGEAQGGFGEGEEGSAGALMDAYYSQYLVPANAHPGPAPYPPPQHHS